MVAVAGLSPRVRGNPGQAQQGMGRRGSIPACAGEPGSIGKAFGLGGVYPRVCGGTQVVRGQSGAAGGLSPRVRGNRPGAGPGYPPARSIPACAGEPALRPSPQQDRTVYPRVCGGTRPRGQNSVGYAGLSPRVRGNRTPAPSGAGLYRSIPACAGEPQKRDEGNTKDRVYPRVCGGTTIPPGWWRAACGLSPRVRGNPDRQPGDFQDGGSIPACAGEPYEVNGVGIVIKVYPRVCGGTASDRLVQQLAAGLSPRVRGNQGAAVGDIGVEGSIPACAGEPSISARRRTRLRVYPRVCGGTRTPLTTQASFVGLSPRVRGNRAGYRRRGHPDGSIPACAGEPGACGCRDWDCRVYPRVCGGTARYAVQNAPYCGLSPRVRGNPLRFAFSPRRGGSIPACAGEPGGVAGGRGHGRVYPRVCGGTRGRSRRAWQCHGLSPRVRGNRQLAVLQHGAFGSIPACAGEPA